MQKTTIKKKFKSAIRRGTGEAHLILKDNPGVDFSKEILEAAVKNFAYDPQCEGNRAIYISELINFSNKKGKLVEGILKALSTERSDTWALSQLFGLAAIFAKEGNFKSRKAIYKRFCHKIIEGSDWCGQNEIIELDGFEGLKHIVEIKGEKLAKYLERWEDSFFVDSFQEDNPAIKVYEELETLAENNIHIKTYLNAIKKNKRERSKVEKSKYNYETVKQQIENLNYISPFVTKSLSSEDIKKLANDFLSETNKVKQEKYLLLFCEVKFPFEHQPILKIVKNTNAGKGRLAEFAIGALQYFSGDDIRQFAIEKLNKTNKPADYVKLLVSNYKEGDSKLLTTIARKFKDEEIIHSLAWGYVAIYDANQTKECKEPLEAIYDKLTCGLHRGDIVKILIENSVLSNRIYQEIKHDSSEEVRELRKKVLETA